MNLRFLVIFVLAVSFIACEEENGKEEPIVDFEEGVFIGKLSVDQNDDTFYEQENVEVVISRVDENTINMDMLKVKFSNYMPVSLDMSINGIEIVTNEDRFLLSGDNIIPTAMGGPFPRYTITAIEGELTSQDIAFSMICGEFPLTFSGTVKSE